uniref:Ganglioside GM2 activator n=1 Tax=Esox lucius TaxID=8010 RepID=C1BZQ8_ESOLU|nr:Ganglioside GM2 activator precursor [Esox lucius]
MKCVLVVITLCIAMLMPVNCAMNSEKTHTRYSVKMSAFSWDNCERNSPLVVSSLTVSPDPITIPGNLTGSASVSTTVDLASPLAAIISVEKKTFGTWIKIPCDICTYTDVCTLLNQLMPPEEGCPKLFNGQICHCPFKAGEHKVSKTNVSIPDLNLPSFLTNGNYRVQGVLRAKEKVLCCLKVSFALQSKKYGGR